MEPETDYRLASWVEASTLREGNGAFFGLKEIPEARSETLKWRASWQELEVFFNSGQNTQLNINLNYIGGNPFSGTVTFDDVSLCQVLDADDSAGNIVGDAVRGKTIFYEHEIASCTRCHQVGGAGGVVGPALDGIATHKPEDYIRESLVDPQAAIAEGFPIEVSPMPPFGVLLSPQELEDVIAYLKTLQ